MFCAKNAGIRKKAVEIRPAALRLWVFCSKSVESNF